MITTPIIKRARGIDVSVAQFPGSINWAVAKAAGQCDFAIFRQGYGNKIDGAFKRHAANALEAGIVLLGAYQFCMVDADPSDEVDTFFKSTEEMGLSLPAVLDVETSNGRSPASTLQYTWDWGTKYQQISKIKPVLYTGKWFWDSLGARAHDASWADLFDLHLAAYTTSSDPQVPIAFQEAGWALHQFSGNTIWRQAGTGQQKFGRTQPGPDWTKIASATPVAGVSGEVDCNYFNGTLDQMRLWAGDSNPYEPGPTDAA